MSHLSYARGPGTARPGEADSDGGYSVFYDEFESLLWGKTFSVKLHEVYGSSPGLRDIRSSTTCRSLGPTRA
jgi:hypothetical protein